MVVGALIFVLGIDLIIESVWDTRNRVNRMEYITIWVIMIGMTIFDFVIGLLLGVILACVFFVVQSSRRRPIRAVFTGSSAKSTVRRPRAQRAFIQNVGSQTMVMKLQGFLFFGTISVVEDEIRKLLDLAAWENHPIRFLIIDFYRVAGLDFSSAEAFVRIQRLLAAKDVLLVLTGVDPHSHVGTALRAVDLWADQEGTRVEVFGSLNDALEWTENAYLIAFYENQKNLRVKTDDPPRSIDLPKINRMPFSLAESFQNSPRRSHLARAGDDNLSELHWAWHELTLSIQLWPASAGRSGVRPSHLLCAAAADPPADDRELHERARRVLRAAHAVLYAGARVCRRHSVAAGREQ
jgi:SulP family sulfate permease